MDFLPNIHTGGFLKSKIAVALADINYKFFLDQIGDGGFDFFRCIGRREDTDDFFFGGFKPFELFENIYERDGFNDLTFEIEAFDLI